MLLEMAFTTLSVIGSLLVLQQSFGSEQARYLGSEQCTNEGVGGIWANLPPCKPRDTLVGLPLPDDANVVEVIPSHVMVPRCSGVCHEGNLYHHCVPTEDGRSTKLFEV